MNDGTITAKPVRVVIFIILLAMVITIGLICQSKSHFSQRVEDLSQIRDALEAYKTDNGGYPQSGGVTVVAAPVKEDWISGLAPHYLPVVPRDPRRLSVPNKQYLYISDGKDYKIIAHGAEDTGYASKKRPDMIDPRRPDYAYGFWSQGARSW